MNRGKRDSAELRRRAEQRLAGRHAQVRHAPGQDAEGVLHELMVHQIELELQNEELRNSRLELEGALERYTQLFDFAPIGYFAIGGDGAIREVNFAGARLLGAERSRLVGLRFGGFLATSDLQRFDGFLADALVPADDRSGPVACEVSLRPGAAGGRDVRITAAELEAPGSAGATVLLAVEDVSARRQAEHALREEVRRKDEFLAALSHELRNPLGPLRNGVYLLEHAQAGGEQARRSLAIVGRQVDHLTRIVEDLLDVTRIAHGKVRLGMARLELGGLVRRSLDDHQAAFQDQAVALELSPVREDLWVEGDATRLAQVLGNLLSNALKFTSRGGRVGVSLRRDGANAALSVRDDGAGIEPEVLERLFEPFSQAPQTLARTPGGLGLGLAMVKGLVELHGGAVAVASKGLGRGSEFTIRLPLASPPQAAMHAASHAASPTSPPRPPARHRVLVIEDNEDAATSLKEVLELSGHDVRVAADGPAGLALVHVHRPEVVICDIGLPGMSGYEVARAIRADAAARGAFLIALTGYARPDDARRAAEAGFDRHVGKPPPLETLESLLADIPLHVEPVRPLGS